MLTSLFDFTQVILGMIIDTLLLGKTYNLVSYIGLVLLGLSLVGASFVKRKKGQS